MQASLRAERDNQSVIKIIREDPTDRGLERLKELRYLTELDLTWTEISNDGLANIKGLSSLTVLYLSFTKISDKGLEHLQKLTNLRMLWLNATNTSDQGTIPGHHNKTLRQARL